MWRILKKLKRELLHHPAIPLMGICPKEIKTGSQRDICTPIFTATLSTIAKMWKPPKSLSTDEWIKEMWCVYSGIFFSHETEHPPFVTTWMRLEGIMLSETMLKEKDKCCMISLMRGI